jgi:hypothetical protein
MNHLRQLLDVQFPELVLLDQRHDRAGTPFPDRSRVQDQVTIPPETRQAGRLLPRAKRHADLSRTHRHRVDDER